MPPWSGEPKEAFEVWTLRKHEHVASCHLWTHPKGGEARFTIDAEMYQSSAGVDARALLDLALDWQQQFEARGWE
jgi:hypothetical protein